MKQQTRQLLGSRRESVIKWSLCSFAKDMKLAFIGHFRAIVASRRLAQLKTLTAG
jgi:hypothetical protein